MPSFLKHSFICFFLLFFIASCKKDEQPLSNVPELDFISVSPGTVKEYQDSITFTIAYKDGNGDIGENDPNAKNLYLSDSRNGVVYQYRVKELAPKGSSISIEGKLNIVLKNTGITNGSTSQSVSYSIYLNDRAGNKSNVVNSPAITVNK